MLFSGGDQTSQQGRWSILAEPREWVVARQADDVPAVFARVFDAHKDGRRRTSLQIPFAGGWIGGLSYELGRIFEPSSGDAHRLSLAKLPLAAFAWCPRAWVFDHLEEIWWEVDAEKGASRCAGPATDDEPRSPGALHVNGCASSTSLRAENSDDAHRAAVERAIEYIRAGDIFQANITRRYAAEIECDPRVFALAAFEVAQPRYGAYLELPGARRVISMSPELFVELDAASRRVVTRPIKGTRPAGCDPLDLWQSEKDAAELHMIVDLMRNDLGRVCEYGSVRVDVSRTIETHPTVHHGVAQVSGQVRVGATAGDIVRAAFPAGSITGAPKIRAMQVIEELEPQPRDWYCGAIGFVDVRGNMTLNVAIRTMMLEQANSSHRDSATPRGAWTLRYGAGGGIVADSNAEDELRECDQKTEVLRQVLASLKEQDDRGQSESLRGGPCRISGAASSETGSLNERL